MYKKKGKKVYFKRTSKLTQKEYSDLRKLNKTHKEAFSEAKRNVIGKKRIMNKLMKEMYRKRS